MTHAERELDILVKTSTDPNNRPIIEEFIPEILALVKKFSKSGQSGGSAPYTAGAIADAVKKLCLQKPLCPITGIDDEWTDISSFSKEPTFQNNRLSSIFKDSKEGRAYYLDAIVWQGEDEYDTFTGKILGVSSRQYIKSFPFTPKTFYIDVVRDFNVEGLDEKDIIETGVGRYTYKLKNPEQLAEVFQYYEEYKN